MDLWLSSTFLLLLCIQCYPALSPPPSNKVTNSDTSAAAANSTADSADDDDPTSVEMTGPAATEKALFKDLFDKYDKNIRPNFNTTVPLRVELGLIIRRIEYLDEKRQTLLFHATTRLRWTDPRLVWKMEDYDRVEDIAYSSFALWVPDIRLTNQAGEVGSKTFEHVMANVYHDGLVHLSSPSAFKVYCGMDFGRWPYDLQTCVIEFESFTYDGTRLDLQLLGNNQSAALVSPFASTNEWRVLGLYAEKKIKTYECCPGEYHSIFFAIRLQRNEPFYRPLMLTPMVLMIFASWLLFLLPLQGSIKFVIGAVELVFVASFALFLKSNLPQSLEDVPHIVTLTLNTMVLILMALFVQTGLHGLARLKCHMPQQLKTAFIDGLGRICCLKQPSGYMKSIPNSNIEVGAQEVDHFEMSDSSEALIMEKSRQEWFVLASVLNRAVFSIHIVISFLILL